MLQHCEASQLARVGQWNHVLHLARCLCEGVLLLLLAWLCATFHGFHTVHGMAWHAQAGSALQWHAQHSLRLGLLQEPCVEHLS